MKARIWGIGLMLMAAGLITAGEVSPHEQSIRQMLGSLDDISKILRSIESEDNANAAKPDLRKNANRWVEARARADKMQPPERAEKDRLSKLYRPKFDEALKKLAIEVGRVEVIPGGKEALKEISAVLRPEKPKQ